MTRNTHQGVTGILLGFVLTGCSGTPGYDQEPHLTTSTSGSSSGAGGSHGSSGSNSGGSTTSGSTSGGSSGASTTSGSSGTTSGSTVSPLASFPASGTFNGGPGCPGLTATLSDLPLEIYALTSAGAPISYNVETVSGILGMGNTSMATFQGAPVTQWGFGFSFLLSPEPALSVGTYTQADLMNAMSNGGTASFSIQTADGGCIPDYMSSVDGGGFALDLTALSQPLVGGGYETFGAHGTLEFDFPGGATMSLTF